MRILVKRHCHSISSSRKMRTSEKLMIISRRCDDLSVYETTCSHLLQLAAQGSSHCCGKEEGRNLNQPPFNPRALARLVSRESELAFLLRSLIKRSPPPSSSSSKILGGESGMFALTCPWEKCPSGRNEFAPILVDRWAAFPGPGRIIVI